MAREWPETVARQHEPLAMSSELFSRFNFS
jgi:hypothetical protein